MTSLRHTGSRAAAASLRLDERLDVYLDAARECILDVGWRRATLTEIARRAGVSRMTIYRSWADMNALLGDLLTREWLDIAATTHPAAQPDGATGPPTPESIAAAAVATARALRANPLFVRIVELDPELLLPYLLSRRGRSQQALTEILAGDIAAGQAAGVVREGVPLALARALVLSGHGFAFSALTMVGEGVELADLDAEFELQIRRSLAP